MSAPVERDPLKMTCSTCGRAFLLDETPTPPFCSQRCQMIDLGRWLDEEIGMPHEGGSDEVRRDLGRHEPTEETDKAD